MLIDSHAHLDGERFAEDRDAVVERAVQNGVDLIINPGADLETSRAAVALAARYPMVYAAVGVHPHDVKDMTEAMLAEIETMASQPKVVAIGEIGLDFHYDYSPRDVQRKWFVEQIALAKRLGLPIIVHDREANQETYETLVRTGAFDTGVLMHCYSGSAELAKQYIRKGAYLSVAGPVTFDNARKLVEVVKTVSLDRLMVETDSPYLTPVPYRGKRNEPAYVKHVAERVATIKGIEAEAAMEQTARNVLKFFRIPESAVIR